MGRLDGKRVVLTGAASGIGRAACALFLREGATLVGVDIDAEGGASLAEELREHGERFRFERLDVSSEDEIVAFARRLADDWPTLDVLYNNAGVIRGKALLDSTMEDWSLLHDVNSKSVFLTMRELAPLMTNPGGSIVNTSSGGGILATPNMSVYSAAKAGVIMLSRCAAVDLAPGIRVNAILPGVIDTPMPRDFVAGMPAEDRQRALDDLAAEHLVGRLGQPEEIAAAALFLASDEASFVTGSAMCVDGGSTARLSRQG